jgi:hypothetical protein
MRTPVMAAIAAPMLFCGAFAGGVALNGAGSRTEVRHEVVRPLAELVRISEDVLGRVDKEQWVEDGIGFYGHALAEALVVRPGQPIEAAAMRFDEAQRCAYTRMSPRIADPILVGMRHDMISNAAEQRAYLRLLEAVSARPGIDPTTEPCMM